MNIRAAIGKGVAPAQAKPDAGASPKRELILAGSPNVGKSALFNALTGSYAAVSNYSGTTVEVSTGSWKASGAQPWDVIDTPGMYSMRPITEEERVARDMVCGHEGVILHVVDAKNLPRMLPLTLELMMLGKPLILVCNLMDEAEDEGVSLDLDALSQSLGVPVVAAVATRGKGLDEIAALLDQPIKTPAPPDLPLPLGIQSGIAILEGQLVSLASRRYWATRHIEGDESAMEAAPVPDELLERALAKARGGSRSSTGTLVAKALRERSDQILTGAFSQDRRSKVRFLERLDSVLMNPWTGVPVLLIVLYFGLYQFVGVFGGGFLVGLLEGKLFGGVINPFLDSFFAEHVPWPSLHGLFVGEYGIFTLALRYAVAVIMPIVGTFFLAFSILEDSGYLPRISMLLDGVFKRMGLNGRAVIPLVLGFGCNTMATMVTRILETRRERVIATFLLALAVPCSAQLGVMLGLLGGHPAAFAIWISIILGVFLAAGSILSRFLPGERPRFFMELPPLRLPSPRNVWSKVVTRMGWYFIEVIPLFVAASALIWLGVVTGLFDLALDALAPVVHLLGLPTAASKAFLFGFFRRDYGAAGLYDLVKAGQLDGVQLLVSAVTLTLFLPCIAQFLMMKKERGWAATLSTTAAVLAVALGTGFVLNMVLASCGVSL